MIYAEKKSYRHCYSSYLCHRVGIFSMEGLAAATKAFGISARPH